MSEDDVLFGYRLQRFDLAARTTVSEACRAFGIHRSTYYSWKRRIERHGLGILRPRERRRPRQPNQLSPVVSQHAGQAALARRWLCGTVRAAERSAAAAPRRGRAAGRARRHGLLLRWPSGGTKGAVWQLTAIDVASSCAWAELVSCPRGNPTGEQTSKLARRVASELSAAGWRLERVLTDNGGEYRSRSFRSVLDQLAHATP